MKIFKCFIRGEGFPGLVVGVSGSVGFYTTHYVRASDESEIESIVWQNMLNDERLSPILAPCDLSEIKVTLEEIEGVPEDDFNRELQGFVWYEMNT